MRLSYSSISMYQNCPLSYRFAYIDKLPTKKTPALSFGGSLHAVFKYFYDVPTPHPPSLEELLNYLPQVWEKAGYLDASEEANYFAHAKEIITKFYNANIKDFKLPYVLEHRFQVELDNCTLSGIIDRMDKLASGGYEIIDYKTNRRLPPKSKVEEDLQLSIYYLAAKSVWGFEPEKLTLYFVLPNEKISTTRNKDDIEKTKKLINETVESIKTEQFEPREGPLCDWCDFQPHCHLRKHKFMRKEEAESKPISTLEIEKAVDEYLSLKLKTKEIEARVKELQEIIHKFCENEGLCRLYSDKGSISRSPRISKVEYNQEKLREILSPLGLWEKILKVDTKLLNDLLQSDTLEEEVKKMIELTKEVEEISYVLYVKETQAAYGL